jgi:WD40 repeat protein
MALFSPVKTIHSRQPSRWSTRSLHLLKQPIDGLQSQIYARDYRDRLLAIAAIFDQREAGIPLLLEALRDPHPRVRALALNCLSVWPAWPEVTNLLTANQPLTCHRTLKHHRQPITALAASPDGRTVLSIAAGDNWFYLWDLATGAIVQTFPNPDGTISQGIFSPDGDYFYTNAPYHRISVWSVATGNIVQQLVGHADALRSVGDHRVTQLAINHQTLISGSADGTIGRWDLGSGQLRNRLIGHRRPITAIAITPDGQTIVSAAHDQTIRTWNTATGKLQRIYQLNAIVHSLAVHPTQPIVWSGDRQARLSSWDYQTGAHLDTLNSWSDRATHQIRPSPNGQILYQTCGSSINRWHTATGWPIGPLIGHRATTTAIAHTPDGKTLISGSDDRTIKIWSV